MKSPVLDLVYARLTFKIDWWDGRAYEDAIVELDGIQCLGNLDQDTMHAERECGFKEA